jgi:hypothetical protein
VAYARGLVSMIEAHPPATAFPRFHTVGAGVELLTIVN